MLYNLLYVYPGGSTIEGGRFGKQSLPARGRSESGSANKQKGGKEGWRANIAASQCIKERTKVTAVLHAFDDRRREPEPRAQAPAYALRPEELRPRSKEPSQFIALLLFSDRASSNSACVASFLLFDVSSSVLFSRSLSPSCLPRVVSFQASLNRARLLVPIDG